MNTPDSVSQEKQGIQIDWKRLMQLVLPVCILIVVSVLILMLANTLTKGIIAENHETARHNAMLTAMPEANVFSDLYSENSSINRISGAYYGTQFKGYCVDVSVQSLGGNINLLVGIDDGGSVTGVSVLDHNELSGADALVNGSGFLQQFVGLSGTVTVGYGYNSIDAIPYAAATSQAITQGVNIALTAAFKYATEGGPQFDGGEV